MSNEITIYKGKYVEGFEPEEGETAIQGSCPHCGRSYGKGWPFREGTDEYWFTPCPSEDCPSHEEGGK